jgi:hypothetical protein
LANARRLVGRHLNRFAVSGDRRSEELRGCGGVTPLGDEHVDDLLVLVDRPVHVAPDPGDFHVGLVDEPPAAYGVAGRPSGLDQHRRESLYPPVQRDVVDLDPSLGEELLEVAIGQAEAQIPAHRQQDHLRREPEAGESRRALVDRHAGPSALHPMSFARPDMGKLNATEPTRLYASGVSVFTNPSPNGRADAAGRSRK